MPRTSLPRKQVPAGRAVLAIVVALVAVLSSSIAMLAWNGYRDAVDRARVRVKSSAQVVATHIEWLTAAGVQALEEADGAADRTLSGGAPIARDAVARHLKHLPPGIAMSFVDASGKALFSTDGGDAGLRPEDGIELSTLGPGRDWSVSAMVVDSGSAAQHFLIARRIVRDGRVEGAAVLRIPVAVMSAYWESLDLGPDSTVGLMRDDGWLVARHPPTSQPVNLSNHVLFTERLKTGDSGVYDAVSPVDGTARIVGYHTVPNAPLVAVASVSRDFALTRLWEQMRDLAIFLVPLVIGLGGLAAWVAKLLRRDEAMRRSLAAAVEGNNLLMREIHHRTKNNLQSVASLLKLQPISDEAKAEMHARIAAMSAVHEQAYRSDLYTDVDLREYLSLLVGNIAKSASGAIAIESRLDPCFIDRDLAQPLGLVVNEVISNALKHAFVGRDRGRIDLTLSLLAHDRAQLVIRDDGVGHAPSGDDKGMGRRLVRAFAQQLGDDYGYEIDNGTRFFIRFPVKAEETAGA